VWRRCGLLSNYFDHLLLLLYTNFYSENYPVPLFKLRHHNYSRDLLFPDHAPEIIKRLNEWTLMTQHINISISHNSLSVQLTYKTADVYYYCYDYY